MPRPPARLRVSLSLAFLGLRVSRMLRPHEPPRLGFVLVAGQDYISLTDMANARTDDDRAADVIKKTGYATAILLNCWEHGRLSITRILKWSNLTTLNHKQVYPVL